MNEKSYVEMLNELRVAVMSDVIPADQREIIEQQIDVLLDLLWKWSA